MEVPMRPFPFFQHINRAYMIRLAKKLLVADSLPGLEKRRADLIAQISHLGDFCPSSITSTQGRCGNPNCHCHKPGEPGHGPNLRLTYKLDSKTITESFATPAAQRKADREVAEFARYRELSRSLIDACRTPTRTPARSSPHQPFRSISHPSQSSARNSWHLQQPAGNFDL